MTTEQTKSMEICRAILSIVTVDAENGIVVNNKLAAEEISQLFLDADCGGGVITGPYLQTGGNVWHISTY